MTGTGYLTVGALRTLLKDVPSAYLVEVEDWEVDTGAGLVPLQCVSGIDVRDIPAGNATHRWPGIIVIEVRSRSFL